jgi:hypothetical protein
MAKRIQKAPFHTLHTWAEERVAIHLLMPQSYQA